jgi:hypothetical protein
MKRATCSHQPVSGHKTWCCKRKGAKAALLRPHYVTISVAFSRSDGETDDTQHNKRDEQERR